jgi:hypothetical protein
MVQYIRALQAAALFPFPENENDLCMIRLGARLRQVKREMQPHVCRYCGFRNHEWRRKLDAITTNIDTMLKSIAAALYSYLIASNSREGI